MCFLSSGRLYTSISLVTGVQTCALTIYVVRQRVADCPFVEIFAGQNLNSVCPELVEGPFLFRDVKGRTVLRQAQHERGWGYSSFSIFASSASTCKLGRAPYRERVCQYV